MLEEVEEHLQILEVQVVQVEEEMEDKVLLLKLV
jgi:hypothetical protein